jgi:V/A-type H+-transporting ATPase subunit A
MQLLEKEAELEEIVRLVGKDTLSPQDRLVLEVARSIREDFLHQNAFHETDTYTSLRKQAAMLSAILLFARLGRAALARGVDMEAIERTAVRDRIARMKYLTEADAPAAIARTRSEMEREIAALEAA